MNHYDGINTFYHLEGKTIAKVRLHGVNCVSVETTDGHFYMVETICVLPSLQLHGVECRTATKEEILPTEERV